MQFTRTISTGPSVLATSPRPITSEASPHSGQAAIRRSMSASLTSVALMVAVVGVLAADSLVNMSGSIVVEVRRDEEDVGGPGHVQVEALGPGRRV